MNRFGCLPIGLFLLLLLLLPVLFGQVMVTALLKLHLGPDAALLIVFGIIFGGLINIPVRRIVRQEDVTVHPHPLFGLIGIPPRIQRLQRETVIAVNIGGCVIPAGLALYEIGHLAANGPDSLSAAAVAVGINSAVCYAMARPVPGVGIALPALIPPVVAALCALMLAPGQATPVAFTAGVMGPLIGADLLHLRDIPRIATGIGAIGGAGTFDGIVLSGILAVYLA